VDKDRNTVPDHTLLRGTDYYLNASLLDASGQAIPYALVTFSVDSGVASLPVTTVLTNTRGVAEVLVKSLGLNATAGSATATSKVNALSISGTVAIQTKNASVNLGALTAPSFSGSLPANQAVNLQTTVTVDGNAAPNGAFTVSFNASCGDLSPASGTTDAGGQVRTSYTPGPNCTNSAKLSASLTSGTVTQTQYFDIKIATANTSAVVFVGATVPTMVSGRVGGAKSQSTLTFKLIDATSSPIQLPTDLNISLDDISIKGGIVFDDGTTAPRVRKSAVDGTVRVNVQAGNLPSPVRVLVQEPISGAKATSWGVAVSSGKAAQDKISLSAEKLSLEALNVDGVSTTLTFSASDRFGNPVPENTEINFVTNGGVVTGSTNGTCLLNASSQCTVTFRSISGTGRPKNGRVTVLAYMSGEEAFTDKNGDGVWQSGEKFVPLGKPYFDADWSGTYEVDEQIVGSGFAQGVDICTSDAYPSVSNTCDTSKWRDDVLVRSFNFLVMASSNAAVTQVGVRKSGGFWVWISDANTDSTLKLNGTQSVLNTDFSQVSTVSANPTINSLLSDAGYNASKTFLYNNAMPSGPTITAAIDTGGAKCTVKGTNIDKFPSNQISGMLVFIRLGAETDCMGVNVSVTVKSPAGVSTTYIF